MSIKECLDNRLLIKIAPDKNKAGQSLKVAEAKLVRAEELFKEEFYDEVLMNCYMSMFHALRALLYKDGIQEKSHYAIYIYINEKYSDKLPKGLIGAFKNYQLERHKLVYGFDTKIKKEEAESILEDTEQLLMEVNNLYGNL